MMKKTFLALGAAATFLLPNVAGAEGFAINEWSAEGVAMGGARMFAEGDAANVAYNPASITKIEGEALKISATYLSPHGKHEIESKDYGPEKGQNVVHAGWAPGTYYVKQMSDKDWFGIGLFTRYGTVSERERMEPLVSSNSFFAQMNGLSLTPTYARKFDNKWSAAVGADINYVGLELQKNMIGTNPITGKPVIGATTQTNGETYALGWNAAVNYAFDEKNEIGLVYRSEITHSMEADFKMYRGGNLITADAYGVVTLPESYAIGYNHKFNDKTRVELNATRTNWSSYDALNIALSNPSSPGVLPPAVNSPKNYEDGWRYAIGVEHELSDKYSLMAGFAYDEGIIPYDGGDFMMPTGNRRTYSIGAQYHDKKQTLAVALGYIDVGDLSFVGQKGDAYDYARGYDNSVKIASISYQLNF